MAEQHGLLIVDDEESVLDIISDTLQKNFPNHVIYRARDAVSALDILEKHPVSLVLTDYAMPNMDGLKLIKRVRKEYPDIQLVMMTGRHDLDVALKSVEAGACQYIQKPFESLNQIVTVVDGALERGSILSQLNQDLMSLIIGCMPEAIILIDREKKVKFVNPHAKWLLQSAGVEEKDLDYEKVVSIIGTDPWMLARIWPPTKEVKFEDGTYELFVTPLDNDGSDALGYLLLLHDLSARRESERLQREFLSIASHELRTPLSVIKSGLDIILNEKINLSLEKAKPILQRSTKHIVRLTKLVADILDLSKIESGVLKLSVKEVAVGPLFQELFAFLNSAPIEGQPELLLKVEKGVPEFIEADPDRLQQIVINLVDNALKFSPTDKPVTLKVSGSKDELIVEIIDNGPGIQRDKLRDIFKKFKQGDPSLTRIKAGAGLGLPIAKSLVEAHGGAISVDTKEGDGSTFRFILPAKSKVIQ